MHASVGPYRLISSASRRSKKRSTRSAGSASPPQKTRRRNAALETRFLEESPQPRRTICRIVTFWSAINPARRRGLMGPGTRQNQARAATSGARTPRSRHRR